MSEQKEEIRLSLKLDFVPVVLEDENGEEIQLQLKTMTGQERDSYLDAFNKRTKVEDGNTQILNFKGFQSDLLSRCLFDENNEHLTASKIQGFPAVVINKLFEKANEINALDVESQQAAKND